MIHRLTGPHEALLAVRLPALLGVLLEARRALAAEPSAYVVVGVHLESGRFSLAAHGERGQAHLRFAGEGLVRFMRCRPESFADGLEAACAAALRRLRWVIEEEARFPGPDGGPLVVSEAIVAAVSDPRVA